MTIQQKLEKAREELLDLGFRNYLINYRPLKSKGIHIQDEESSHLYDMLVSKNRVMYFEPGEEKDENNADLELFDLEQPDEKADQKKKNNNRIQTKHNSRQLQRRLLNTYYTARTHIQERGVNILYLAIGMLEWYESESSEVRRKSPLLLIPVELSRSDVQSKFKINFTGDEVGTNLSLIAKLKMEFGIEIPNLIDSDDIDVDKYFSKVSKKIKNQTNWQVNYNEQAIGFFSFNKYLMYNDLDPKNWPNENPPYEHPIIKRLLEEGFNEPSPVIGNEEHIDDFLDPKDIKHVMDADSSQTLAISDVNEGRNLVIQGPPGTGKSQTITNIIAESIYKGKQVLFVSEKMAALEVVKRRLDQVGLGDACIELHSNKSNKKVFLNELERTLNLNKPIPNNKDQISTQLKKNRDDLNQYCAAVNNTMGESNHTPYEAYGSILKLKREFGDLSLPEISNELLLNLDYEKFDDHFSSIQNLESQIDRIGHPKDHPYWGCTLELFLPSEKNNLEVILDETLDNLDLLIEAQNELSENFSLNLINNWNDAEKLINICSISLEAPVKHPAINFGNDKWLKSKEQMKNFLLAGREISRLKSKFGSKLINEAWNQEVNNVRKLLVSRGEKWWTLFSKDYWKAKKTLAELLVEKLPKELEEQLNVVEAILKYQRLKPVLKEHEITGKELFQDLYKGEESDWDNLISLYKWSYKLHSQIDKDNIPNKCLEFFKSRIDRDTIQNRLKQLKKQKNLFDISISKYVKALGFDEKKKFDGEELFSQSYSTLEAMFTDQLDRIDIINEMISLNYSIKEFDEKGLGEITNIAVSWKPSGRYLSRLFNYRWLQAYLNKTLKEKPELAGFNSEVHYEKLNKFKHYDKQLLEQNRAEIAKMHWDNLPDAMKIGAVGTLKREFNKKRRHLPIRKLTEKAGNAIQAIKPVFMMSPLSVATYLPPGAINFDLIVFDEASQVRPVDAFGPLLRAKQAVVVGDSKQLPPTSFFDAEIDDSDEIDYQSAGDMESILGLFEGNNAPSRMLRWHYRSEHESLIAVSNNEFYDNKLVLFPSPDVNKLKSGIKYHYNPQSVYEPGRGKSYNKIEARQIAQAVVEHASKNPDLSLGVAAFSVSQKNTILDELEILRRNDSSHEHYFNKHPEEPFFVKNLENVQGDERDVIFISIGYGKDEGGNMSMNFGPMNKEGGERRLNVLVTRARKRCEVFCNFLSEDIDLGRTQARGMIALKKYLKYAKMGILDLPKITGKEADSYFEEEVAHEIRSHGFEVDHQIGSAGFFVDLGIKNPELADEYLLGIECDGATYHSTKSARDRDRIRQEVLERLGWNIYRIWSTDWFMNKEKETQKLLREIRKYQKHPDYNDLKPSQNKKSTPAYFRSSISSPSTKNQPVGERYTEAKISNPEKVMSEFYNKFGYYNTNEALILKVVEIEAPIHKDLVIKKIADIKGYGRIGRRIELKILSGFENLILKNCLKEKDRFFSMHDTELQVRNRAYLNNFYRDIQYIAPDEIKLAIKLLTEKSFGANKDDLIKEVGTTFGFGRVTNNIYSTIEKNLKQLLKKGELKVEAGNIFVDEN